MRTCIVVVEDSQSVRAKVSETLRAAGFDVVEAEDGVTGLDALERTTECSLCICDVNMPRMTGLELLAAAKAKPALAAIPFLMLTTEAKPQLVNEARKVGAKGWLVKPFRADILLSAVRKLTQAPA